MHSVFNKSLGSSSKLDLQCLCLFASSLFALTDLLSRDTEHDKRFRERLDGWLNRKTILRWCDVPVLKEQKNFCRGDRRVTSNYITLLLETSSNFPTEKCLQAPAPSLTIHQNVPSAECSCDGGPGRVNLMGQPLLQAAVFVLFSDYSICWIYWLCFPVVFIHRHTH